MSQHGCPERLSNRSKGFQEESGSQPTMEVLVETLTGTAFEMTVSPSDTIFAIKSKICRVEGIPVSQQHLVYNLRELEDAASLRALGIADGARLRLVLRMRGGPVSSRRLPRAPPDAYRDIDQLLDANRDEGSWGCEGGKESGCRVTVVVFREGERVNMLRVRHNQDGSYSPIDHHNYSSTVSQSRESPEPGARVAGAGVGAGPESLQQNAVTMGKMAELRRRMESLSVRRHASSVPGEKADIQKTRSEETLSVPSLVEECSFGSYGDLQTAGFDHLGSYTQFEDTLKVSESIGGTLVVSGGEQPILEECGLADLPGLPAADCGPLVGGETSGWLTRTFGSSSQLSPPHPPHPPPPRAPPHARSASSLLRAPPHPFRNTQLSELFSSSTSDLEALRRHRILPALARHRNTEHLHLSDDTLHVPDRRQRIENADRLLRLAPLTADSDEPKETEKKQDKEPEAKERKVRIRCGFCKKKLSIATVHKCRCGAEFCAPHRYAEVHGCAYDYKAHAHHYLQRANPLVSAPKLPKI